MKNLLITLSCLFVSIYGYSQTPSVEKSIFNVQLGLPGIFVSNEARLTNSIALRSEIGLEGGIYSSYYNDFGFLMTPVITLEPRWYYNLKKRNTKQRRIDQNSGNYVSLNTSYRPDWFVISNEDNLSVLSSISVIPTWGIRRNIGKHFNYETGIGLGIIHYLPDANDYYYGNDTEAAINLHLRIGYTFK